MEFNNSYAVNNFDKTKLNDKKVTALLQFNNINDKTQNSIQELTSTNVDNSQSLTNVLNSLNNYNKSAISSSNLQQVINARSALHSKLKALENPANPEAYDELLQSFATDWETLQDNLQELKDKKQAVESHDASVKVSSEQLNFRSAVEQYETAKEKYGENSPEFAQAKVVFIEAYRLVNAA